MKFVTLNENEFTEFENTHPLGSFYQTIKWGKLKEKNGWKYYLVGVKEDDKVIAACLLLEKKVFLSLTLFYFCFHFYLHIIPMVFYIGRHFISIRKYNPCIR